MMRSNEEHIILKAARGFSTPFYLYNKESIHRSFARLRASFPEQVDIFYSIKANPAVAIVQELHQLGAGVELCSYYELLAAEQAGVDPKNIIFVGPAKSDREISYCLRHSVYAIICESLNELKRISLIASNMGVRARVAMRINPSYVAKSALLKMGGKPSQFGIDEDQIRAAKELILTMPNIHLLGIHVYNGTRILNASTIIENTEYILNLARSLQKQWNTRFEMVDIGGGLGVAYYSGEGVLNMSHLNNGITPIINQYTSEYPRTRIILESGRYLVAESGLLVSRIVDKKSSKGEEFIITDGGTNCHMAAVGIGSIVKRNFPIDVIIKTPTEKKAIYNITGPLCTPGDLVGKKVELPQCEIGDLVVIKNVGAYGPTASPIYFLSHGFPTELLVDNGKVSCIREAFSKQDFFSKQHIIKEKQYEL